MAEELKNYLIINENLIRANIDRDHFERLVCNANDESFSINPKENSPFQAKECSQYMIFLKGVKIISTLSKKVEISDERSEITMSEKGEIEIKLKGEGHKVKYETLQKESSSLPSSDAASDPGTQEIIISKFFDGNVTVSGSLTLEKTPFFDIFDHQ